MEGLGRRGEERDMMRKIFKPSKDDEEELGCAWGLKAKRGIMDPRRQQREG